MRARRRARPEIIAHRGGAGVWAENTLGAFRRSLELGVDLVELDVHRSSDGELVVLHDAQLERTTDGQGLVFERAWVDLAGLNALAHRPPAPSASVSPAAAPAARAGRAFEALPRLGDVLALVRQHPRARVLIDVKHRSRFPKLKGYPGIAARVAGEVRRAGVMGQVRLAAFDLEVLRQARALLPEVPAELNWDHHDVEAPGAPPPARLAARLARAGLTGLSVRREVLTPALIAAAHRYGLRVDAWVVDDPDEARCYEDLGVDGLITDRPDRLMPWVRDARDAVRPAGR